MKSIDSIYSELGKRIVTRRKALNMSQERLAVESGIDRSHLGFIEQGRRKPTLATIYKLLGPLKLRLEELFRGL